MQFFNQLRITVVQALTAGLVHGTHIGDDTYPLVVSQVVPVGNYTLTYWSDAAGVARAANANRVRCDSNDVTCSGSHKAELSTCSELVNQLSTNGGKVVANSPRAICLGQGSDQCCVSWSAAVGNMPQEDLYNAARKVYTSCFASTISGLARNVNLDGHCVTEFLSNRPDGCT